MKHVNFDDVVLTRPTVKGKGRRHWIAAVPGTVKAKIGIASRGDRPIIGEVGHGHRAPRLGVAPVPQLGDRLSIGKGPCQGPSVDGRAPGIGDRDAGPKAAGPLVGDRVVHRASHPACWRW